MVPSFPVPSGAIYAKVLAEKKVVERRSLVGLDKGWHVPVATWAAPVGFDIFMAAGELPHHVFSVKTAGGHMVGRRPGQPDIRAPAGPYLGIQNLGLDAHYWTKEPVEFAHFYFSDELLAYVSGEVLDGKSAPLRDDVLFAADAALGRQAEIYLQRAHDQLSPPSRLEMDSRAALLMVSLVSRFSGLAVKEPFGGKQPSLAPYALRRVCEYIEAHMTEDILLEVLAGLVSLSRTHFARAFKGSTGVPPHVWLIQRRIERAKELLLGSELSVLEVSMAVGYDDPNQLARVFRKFVGVSPNAFRRSQRR